MPVMPRIRTMTTKHHSSSTLSNSGSNSSIMMNPLQKLEEDEKRKNSRKNSPPPVHPTALSLKDVPNVKMKPGKKQNFVRSLWKTRLTEDTTEDRELYVKTTLRELAIYIGFIIILCILTFGMTNSTMYYFTKVMKGLFADEGNFQGIQTMEGFWGYAEGPLLDGLHWENYYNGKAVKQSEKGYIYFENKLLGLPRLRQVRVLNTSCDFTKKQFPEMTMFQVQQER